MNLLSNAIDALEDRDRQRSKAEMKARPSNIGIQTKTLATVDGQVVQIQISDNGPGMDAETRERLFTPFFTTKPVGKGTGLGLSISYQIITEKHDGNLTCTSELGKGTTFTMTLAV